MNSLNRRRFIWIGVAAASATAVMLSKPVQQILESTQKIYPTDSALGFSVRCFIASFNGDAYLVLISGNKDSVAFDQTLIDRYYLDSSQISMFVQSNK
ncbi:hypothetical protein G6678_01630 [Polynucleobacter paneuropaeus]|nr:hypothetical protein G6678_01630 [Polynucleobacter paneuropaeus]